MDIVLMVFLVSMSIHNHNLEMVLILLVVNLEVDQVVLVVKGLKITKRVKVVLFLHVGFYPQERFYLQVFNEATNFVKLEHFNSLKYGDLTFLVLSSKF
jgi:hypothetical protein